MDPTDTSSLPQAGAAIVLLALVLCLPLLWYVVRVWRPLRVKRGATKLGRGWTLNHVTGRVTWSRVHTQTTVTTYYDDASYPSGSRTVVSDVFDDLTVQEADGSTHNVQVVNFNVSPAPNQVVSIWTAEKGRQAITVAVLNHTTNRQHVNDQHIVQIMVNGVLQIIFVLYICLLAIPIVIMTAIALMAGTPAGWLAAVVFFILLILFAIGQKRVRSKFVKKGIPVMWKISRAEAAPLMTPQP